MPLLVADVPHLAQLVLVHFLLRARGHRSGRDVLLMHLLVRVAWRLLRSTIQREVQQFIFQLIVVVVVVVHHDTVTAALAQFGWRAAKLASRRGLVADRVPGCRAQA